MWRRGICLNLKIWRLLLQLLATIGLLLGFTAWKNTNTVQNASCPCLALLSKTNRYFSMRDWEHLQTVNVFSFVLIFYFFLTSSHCACVHGPTTTLLSESLRSFLIISKFGKCYTTFRKGTKLFTLHTYLSVISANFLKFNSFTRGRDSWIKTYSESRVVWIEIDTWGNMFSSLPPVTV